VKFLFRLFSLILYDSWVKKEVITSAVVW